MNHITTIRACRGTTPVMLRGTQSLPFRAGEQRRIAAKVIDFRGNEAIRILDLP